MGTSNIYENLIENVPSAAALKDVSTKDGKLLSISFLKKETFSWIEFIDICLLCTVEVNL